MTQQHALNPPSALPPQTVATALVGAALIQYRVNPLPEHKARLQALADMAIALGALNPTTWHYVMGGAQ